jgi:hypothetical protein
VFPNLSIPDFSVSSHLSDAPKIDYFVGREAIISLIKKQFQSFTCPQRKIVVLHGLGGIGKTQTAIHFAYQHRQDYTAVLWFNAKDEDTLRQSFVRNANRLPKGAIPRKLLDNSKDLSGLQNLVQAVKQWFDQPRNDRWLLIFDNVDNPKISQNRDNSSYDVLPYFPEAAQGSIMVTTRWSSLDIGKFVELKKLEDTTDEQPSLSILVQTSRRDDLEHGRPESYSVFTTYANVELQTPNYGI